MNADFDPLTLLLMAAAAIMMWKLKSVLGTKTGFERKPGEDHPWQPNAKRETVKTDGPQNQPVDNTVLLEPAKPVWEGYAKEDSPLAKSMENIASLDSKFEMASFMSGVKSAYEMIVDDFAKGKKANLKLLLTAEIFDGFSKDIDRRNQANEKITMQFVGINKAEVYDARLDGNIATLTIRFASEMISATLDKSGEIITGDQTNVRQIEDIWSFERNMTSRNPNWQLSATDDPFE
jgi:predicted lipid-binding transport protein (Tim44 family)